MFDFRKKTNKNTGAVKKTAPSVNKNNRAKIGDVIHSNDKYFQGSDGYKKNRESVVVDKNQFEDLALVKITTKNTKNTKALPSYSKETFFDRRNLYIKDDEGNFINIGSVERVDDNNKFTKSKFKSLSINEVDYIKKTVLSDKKYGKRNEKRLNTIKKRKH